MLNLFQPKFCDSEHEVITPPTGAPKVLYKHTSSAEKDQTIPVDALAGDWTGAQETTFTGNHFNRTYTNFDVDPTLPNEVIALSNASTTSATTSGTPKGQFLSNQRRGNTKMPKRQLIGKESTRNGHLPSDEACNPSKSANQNATPSVRKKTLEFYPERQDEGGIGEKSSLNRTSIQRESISAPVSEEQANDLLKQMQTGRVSVSGMQSNQLLDLVKCIAQLTNKDPNLVYKLLQTLLASEKEQEVSEPSSKDLSGHSNEVAGTSAHRRQSSNALQSSQIAFNSSCTDTPRKPISSVLPLSSDPISGRDVFLSDSMGNVQEPYPDMTVSGNGTGSYQSKSDLSGPNETQQHDQLNQSSQMFSNAFQPADANIFHSTRLADRFSDPSPLVQRKPTRDARLAVSVSPVRRTFQEIEHQTERVNDFLPTSVVETSMICSAAFHPLIPSRSMQSSRYSLSSPFVPLQHIQDSEFQPTAGSYQQSSHVQPTNLFDTPQVMQRAVVYPSDFPFTEICCIGDTKVKMLPIHNACSKWMQCELQVTLFSCNDVEVSMKRYL